MRKKNPLELKAHSLNYKLYGKEKADPGLVESIRKFGVLEPLKILGDGTIISGHRRWKAAMEVKPLPKLPCEIIGFPGDREGELLKQETIIEHNRQRVKTDQQIAREGEVLEKIYAERAQERQKQTLPKKGEKGFKSNTISKASVRATWPPHKSDQEKKPEGEKGFKSNTISKASVGANLPPHKSDQEIKLELPEDDEGLQFLENLQTAQPELDKPGKTAAKVAEKVGVSERKYKQMQRVRKARDSSDPAERQIYNEFEKGDVTANKAETQLREVKKKKEKELNPKYEFIKDSTKDPNPKVATEAGRLLKLVDKGVFLIDTAYTRLHGFITSIELEKSVQKEEKDIKDETPEKPKGVLAKGTVKKMIQTKLDSFKSNITQISPGAVDFLQEYFEEKTQEITIKAAKAAQKEDRKTIEESDIRRALKIPVR